MATFLPLASEIEHEPAAPEVSGLGMRHGKREPNRHRRVNRVAASLQNIRANPRCDPLLRGDHAIFGDDRLKPRFEADDRVSGRIVRALRFRLSGNGDDGGENGRHGKQGA